MKPLIAAALALSAVALPLGSTAQTESQQCDPNYEGACIQPYSEGDVDCGEIRDRNFQSVGSDPHRLDRDKDGVACEKR